MIENIPRRYDRVFFRRFFKLLRPFWVSSEKWVAISLLIIVIAFTILQVVTRVELNLFYKTFYDALQNFDTKAIIHALGRFLILAIFYITFASFGLYATGVLNNRWRRFLTFQYLGQWFQDDRFYRMPVLGLQVDNPDQRISEDLDTFPSMTLALFVSFLNGGLTLISFGYILWTLSGQLIIPFLHHHLVIDGYLFWVSLAYAVGGTYITMKIGRFLPWLNYQQQHFNANFRYNLVRTREFSEQIALYRGNTTEIKHLHTNFSRIFSNYLSIIGTELRLNLFLNGYALVSNIIGVCASLPMYLKRKIQLGTVMQVARAFEEVNGAMSLIMTSYTSIATWYAVIYRLSEFKDRMHETSVALKSSPLKVHTMAENGNLHLEHVTVGLPNRRILIKDLDLQIKKQERLLVMGRSGCGKSTLFRTIGGIWPYAKGEIILPSLNKMMFLPQKPYFPLGTLKQALCYPFEADYIEDKKVIEILKECGLDYLEERLFQLASWEQELSWGEQQLVAIGRVLLHKPEWLFLDEATSALDDESEKLIFSLLAKHLPHLTLVSVGHRKSLIPYHYEKIVL